MTIKRTLDELEQMSDAELAELLPNDFVQQYDAVKPMIRLIGKPQRQIRSKTVDILLNDGSVVTIHDYSCVPRGI